ncbi:CyaA2 [Desulforapulum autotrophicum HRM2]|uniref:CyaA2 n=1 Tax=Desulforapulum autotrophicum (strain ATCC 43914 / DSM 3382 / VKM B-1955 / HRM2) TaxID=177437 RepID=C0QEU2_DESAH|nr:class I adenylate cyclase [Desulforapulum autotrophicum]ACN15434.1 CyaA2 [Desulforapulum autotrophicum HRM2]
MNSNGFDLRGFDWAWDNGDETVKLDFIDRASQLSPAQGIVPVLAGIDSLHLSVRNRAREALGLFKSKMIELERIQATHPTADPLGYIQESSVFSARIFALLNPNLPVQEIRLYMEILLEAGGRGPFYAWRFYQDGGIPKHTLKAVILTISEPGRLALVVQYLKSAPSLRRRLAPRFKAILKGITCRQAVTVFFARLFDSHLAFDPFLVNISPELRDPETLVAEDLGTNLPLSDPQQRATAVKALAMMVPRIDPDLVLALLSSNEDRVVHSAVLAVIEASPQKTYADIFEPLLEWGCTCKAEGLAGLRALIVSTPLPLLMLINTVKARAPQLIGPLCEELATLSKISFVFIQEITMDKLPWLGSHPEICKALVFGMIKKRPERVVKLLERFGRRGDTAIHLAITNIATGVDATLSKERRQITADGSKLRLRFKSMAAPDKKLSFLDKMRFSSVKKQLSNIKQGRTTERLDCSDKTLDQLDLSSGTFFSPTVFDGCMIKNSNFSFSSFANTSFRSAIFDTVNLNGSRFDAISFDCAVFMNVSANGAVFTKCSFENASFFGVSLESARMTDCVFTGAQISTSLFVRADLSGSTFAGTRTADVSFVESILADSDFSGVQASFTRFPSHTVSTLEADRPNFNFRMFLFDPEDLPDFLFDPKANSVGIVKDLVFELDSLILTDLIHSGEKLFLNQNRLSILTAMDVFKPKQADLFEIIPLLIHENIDFPGYQADLEQSPRGIAEYRPCKQTVKTASRYVNTGKLECRFSELPHVEGLFTMGSTGTIAQAPDSDIDYWVCVRGYDPECMEEKRFQQKLTLLEQWALGKFKTEIHFFIVDIDRARIDDFGDSTRESSGSAQGMILKEEFYRTMIHVAGKLPFWCTLPVSVSREYYGLLLSRICANRFQCRFIDFGDIHEIPSAAYFGASIWQLFKLLESPFKSVIKMALLEEFLYARGKKQLLCNRFKAQWMDPGLYLPLGKIDPYYILLKSLVDYYGQVNNPAAERLVQQCFFLKTGITKDSDLDETLFSMRSFFITRAMDEWAWTRKMVFENGNFRQWQYLSITRLSRQIQQYMVKTYIRINQAIDREQCAMITPEDRTVLGRKMFVEFSSQPGKIPKTLMVSRSDRHFTSLVLTYLSQTGKPSQWALVNRFSRSAPESREVIRQAETIEEIAAWFIQNQLFSPSTIINLLPNPTPVSSNDIQGLFQALYRFFNHDNGKSPGSKNLLSKARITAIFISINLCVPRKKRRIHDSSAIYLNSWGEMFCIRISSQQGFVLRDEILERLKTMLELKTLPDRIFFHYPGTFHR